MQKAELLVRLGEILERVRMLVQDAPLLPAHSAASGYVVGVIESELDAMESAVAIVIDNLMAKRYANHNTQAHSATTASGLSGRWHQDRWSAERSR